MSEGSINFCRREFVQGAVSGMALAVAPALASAASVAEDTDKAAVLAQIPAMHAANVKRLQDWIALPSIAAEERNYPQGPEYMARLAGDAGFTGVKLIPTAGKPGVFGKIESAARTTMAIYFMYDVKQFDPAEWSSPPLEARLVHKEGLGTVCMGRGAVNQKGPENSFLSALMAFKAAGKKLPVNLVLVCEGEEEIGSPHFREVIMTPEVVAELKKCAGVFAPSAGQDRDGGVQVVLGAKGVVELELISSGQKWGRGPVHDVHSAFEAQVAAAREAGAVAMRAACLGGRRYEVFRSLDQWNEFARDSLRRIARALTIAEKYRIPLGLENHKDWTVDELAALMKEYSSEWLGVCLDTGNNVALLDDPMEVVERLAPYTINTHLKDMSLAEYAEGLLLIEPVFGAGFLDLRRIVSTVRQARPDARFTVEQLTRNPLKVPVLTEHYWASFPERNGRHLARTLAAARTHAWRGALPAPEALGRDARIRAEEDNVVECLKLAASGLGMGRV